jgi:hypothetical protein
MVTNGGYGGVQQALANGVPLVVAGDSEDKPEVAARVRWSGTGHRPAHGSSVTVERADVVFEVGAPLRPRNGRQVASLRVDPGQRDLGRRAALGRRPGVDGLDDGDVGGQVVTLEAGLEAAEVVLVEIVDRAHGAGQEAPAERAVGDEADPELPDGGQDLDLGVA